MKTRDFRQKLQDLHVALLNKEKAKALTSDFFNSPIIRQYAEVFTRELPDHGHTLGYRDFCGRLNSAKVVLFGDFHTHRQSQRQFLRSLRQCPKSSGSKRIAIALEAFTTDDQNALDSYMNNGVSEKTFLEQTRYFSKWRFHWPHFKMILDYAKERRLAVFGIEIPKGDAGDRDVHFSKQISRIAADPSIKKVFALVGEHHLTSDKIPKHLAAAGFKQPILRIYQNVDNCYDYSETAHTSTSPMYLDLSEDRLCVLNSPAWHKWKTASEWDDFDDADSNHEATNHVASDIDYEFILATKTILNFFALPVSEEILDCYTLTPLKPKMKPRSVINRNLLNAGGVAIASHVRQVLMSRLNFNYIAQAAGQFLFATGERHDQEQNELRTVFLQMVAGSFASLVMNPKRKITRLGSPDCHLNLTTAEATTIGDFLTSLKHAESGRQKPDLVRLAASTGSAVGSLLFSRSLSDESCAQVSRSLFTPNEQRLDDRDILTRLSEVVGF
jgi:hypothetical protein